MRSFPSLTDLLAYRAARQPEAPCVTVYSDRPGERPSLSFAALHAQASLLAERLAAETAPGDRALLIFPSCLEFVVAYFACLMAGVVAVPMMPPRRNASHDASAAIMADCAPRIALSPAFDPDPRGLLRERLSDRQIRHLPVALAPEVPTQAATPRSATDLAFLQYTSGSTSTPKGVMVSHRNLLDNLEMMRRRLGNDACSAHVSWIPLYHDLGLIMNLLQPIYLGAHCVLLTPSSFMHRPLNWLKAIHEHRAEVGAAPNFAYDLCVDRFRPEQMEGVDLSGWKIALNGAEPVRTSTLERFAATFAPYGFDPGAMRPAYGLAEATLLVSAASRGSVPRVRAIGTEALKAARVSAPQNGQDASLIASCGSAMQGLSLAIIDPHSRRRVPDGAIGEIWIQASSVAAGYWQRPDETRTTFQARIEPGEGSEPSQGDWLRTGDLGHLDADGELYILGRIKDVMIVRGVNHYPQDIEATAATSHPVLRRDHCAAFTVDDGAGTERIVIVLEVGRVQRHAIDEAEVTAAIQQAVVNNHDVAAHRIVLIRPGTLPRTTSGKVQRSLTKQRWLAGALEIWTPAREPLASVAATLD
jgi:acyl-CoA synthetase (AMP-forming)/AMP-acid ligase II